MIRPARFSFNTETAASNAFQDQRLKDQQVQNDALTEFDGFVRTLRENGVDVTVVPDSPEPHTPDSIFPNNWISTHDDGTVILYPMEAPNRRLERRPEVLAALKERFIISRQEDLTSFENDGKYLEGTGSMVLDRDHRIAYACLSTRTHPEVLKEFERRTGYRTISFHAYDQQGTPIYHTNVMMCVGSACAVICLDSISDEAERNAVVQSLRASKKEIIEISPEQAAHFAGNMLELSSEGGDNLLVLSEQAFMSLTAEQKETLSGFCKFVYAPLYVIEGCGGGSARCMVAEIHLARKQG